MTTTFKGIYFPFRKGSKSFPEAVTDSDLIRQSIIQILLTARGERVMRPDFGSGVYSRVFENNDATLEASLEAVILSAIGKFEPRVIISGITVERPEDNQIVVTVNYVIAKTRQQDTVSLDLSTPQ